MEQTKETKKRKFKTIDLAYIGLFAALIAVCAQIAIPMPSGIPFTLQTFAICLTGALLGWKRGILSVIVYILLGMVGLPIFSGFKSGVAAVTGPTGGYLIGFLFTALIIGILADKFGHKLWQMVLFMVLGLIASYVFGTVWFMIAYKATLAAALTSCVVPFLLPEAAKIALAAVLSNRLHKFVK